MTTVPNELSGQERVSALRRIRRAGSGNLVFVSPIVFFGGLSSVGIELSASRLIAPYFGDSTFIWANLIGLTLTYLAIGYYLGGRLADRFPQPWLLYTITAVAAFAAGLVPLMSRPILTASLNAFDRLDAGAFYGALVGVLLLFSVPVTLLGFVTPFAIRLRLHGVDEAGNTAGRIYALSTIGSIAGSFLPVLLLIPLVGTTWTFLTLSLSLLVPSLAGLLLLRAFRQALVAALLTIGLIAGTVAWKPRIIRRPEIGTLVYETESQYNFIQVSKDGDTYILELNDGHAIHSIYNPDKLLTGSYWDGFMVAPLFYPHLATPAVGSAMMIGLAAGTGVRELTEAYGPIPIDGVEIDPKIVDVGRKYFAMTEPNLNVIVADGRYALRTSTKQYDLIGVDAYHQPYIPFQLTTKEFFQSVKDHLTPHGSVVINVGRTETDYRLVDTIATTMRAVFPSVYAIDDANFENTLLIATAQPTALENFAANVARLPADSLVKTVGEKCLASGKLRVAPNGGMVFTDDRAPVEWVTNQIILDVARHKEEP